MTMGRRRPKQRSLFVETSRMATAPRHRFYDALNEILEEGDFDVHVEDLCALAFEPDHKGGRPSLAPGVYFRMLLIGYFEGIESERGICWRCEDSLSLKRFLGFSPEESTPDHSTLSRMRSRLPVATYQAVFHFAMRQLNESGLLRGKRAGVDSTYLRADASMKRIVRRGSGEGYKGYLRRLAKESGIEAPTEEELRRFDRKRKGKKVSNKEWVSATDAEAEIRKLKDGRTRLAYKAEHVVDVDSGAVLSAQILPATESDAESALRGLEEAESNLRRVREDEDDDDPGAPPSGGSAEEPTREIEEVCADKGYHKASSLRTLTERGIRTYIPEPKRKGRRRWKRHGGRKTAVCVYQNRARIKRAKGKALQRKRGELIERSFAHVCESGGHRRVRLRGQDNGHKRYLIQTAAYNLSLLLRHRLGHGTPKQYADARRAARAALGRLWALLTALCGFLIGAMSRGLGELAVSTRDSRSAFGADSWATLGLRSGTSTGC